MFERDSSSSTELGALPSDWQVRRFDSLFAVQQSKQVSKKNRVGENQRSFLRTKNVFWGRLDLADLDEMHFTEAEEKRLAGFRRLSGLYWLAGLNGALIPHFV